MARTSSRPKHKAPTQVTIVQEEKSSLAQIVDRYWRPAAVLALGVTAWILYSDYKDQSKEQEQSAEWDILASAAETGKGEDILKAARTSLVGTGLEGWASLVAASPFVRERQYDDALEAVGAIKESGTPLLTQLTLPIGADGAEVTIADAMGTLIASQHAQDDQVGSIFVNPPPPAGSPVVEMELSLGGASQTIALALYAEEAPKHVENFLKLVRDGSYDGTKFHRIMRGFMIQGGDPNTKDPAKGMETWGQGGPGYKIEPELGELVHARYVLAAAKKSNELQSSGSQFYITAGTAYHLDGIHTVFGAVVEGQSIIDQLEDVPIRPAEGGLEDIPADPIPYIISATVRGE